MPIGTTARVASSLDAGQRFHDIRTPSCSSPACTFHPCSCIFPHHLAAERLGGGEVYLLAVHNFFLRGSDTVWSMADICVCVFRSSWRCTVPGREMQVAAPEGCEREGGEFGWAATSSIESPPADVGRVGQIRPICGRKWESLTI